MSDIIIRVPRSACERKEALAFIESEMTKQFGCVPPPTRGVIMVALVGGQLAGSGVMESTDKDVPFTLEERYAFDRDTCPYPFDRARIIQGTRWIAREKGVSLAILREAANLALDFGKRYMLLEAKPYTPKRLKEMNIAVKSIPSCLLLRDKALEAVGEKGMRYFDETPLPSLYMIDHTEILSA